MPAKRNKTSQKTTRARRPARSAGSTKSTTVGTKEKKASERFVKDLLVRGEAAEPTEEGKLPQTATHVITKKNEDGTVEVKRVRLKLF
jgi:hypothetical protein